MKHRFNSITAILLVIFIAALVQSGCKENTLINSKISPSNNFVSVLDTTLPCITHTFYDDSAITSTNISGIPIFQGVGSILDPFFGTITSNTYFNVIPTTYYPDLFDADSVSIDSAFVILPYGYLTYGDSANTSLTQTYQVFYMLDTMGYNSTYYAYSTKPIDVAHPLSDPITVNLHHLTDSFSLWGINHAPVLRLKLKTDVFMSHLTPAMTVLSNTTATADFLNAFKGICVRAANNNQTTTALPYFRLDGSDAYSEANIMVFYHHPTYAVVDTVTEVYYFNNGVCSHFSNVSTSYSRYPLNNLLHSTQANDAVVALQNAPGSNIDVLIPGIKSLPQGIINNAWLEFTLLPAYYSDTFQMPERLYPVGIGNGVYPTGITGGLTYLVADRYPISSTSAYTIMDGTEHDVTVGATTYKTFTIGLPREVMASIAAKNDTIHLHISGTQDFYGAYRMVAGGGNYPDSMYRAKLKVVYSALK